MFLQVLGLWGMGGIGKTTLAAKLFNGLLPGFGDASCFLGNVRTEAGPSGGLIKLQQKLLKALIGGRVVVEDIDSGTPPVVLRLDNEYMGCLIFAAPAMLDVSLAVCPVKEHVHAAMGL